MWSVHLLEEPVGTLDTPYTLAEGTIAFRLLPFFASTDPATTPTETKILRTWHPYDEARIALMVGLDWAKSQNAHVYRLSLGLLPHAHRADDPLSMAIHMLTELNRIVVVAAGNWGPKPNTLSELARHPDVISVGATASDGTLLPLSSRGTAGGCAPTVVADGTCPTLVVDDAGTEAEPLPPGSSFAAVVIANLCVYMRSMLQWITMDLNACRDGNWSGEKPPPSCLANLDTAIDQEIVVRNVRIRSSKMIVTEGDAFVDWTFGLERRDWLRRVTQELTGANLHFNVTYAPATICRLLVAAADPGTCSDTAGCGAGFVDPAAVFLMFQQLTPSAFHRYFGEREPTTDGELQLLSELDSELGPLFGPGVFAYSHHEYWDKHADVFARVV